MWPAHTRRSSRTPCRRWRSGSASAPPERHENRPEVGTADGACCSASRTICAGRRWSRRSPVHARADRDVSGMAPPPFAQRNLGDGAAARGQHRAWKSPKTKNAAFRRRLRGRKACHEKRLREGAGTALGPAGSDHMFEALLPNMPLELRRRERNGPWPAVVADHDRAARPASKTPAGTRASSPGTRRSPLASFTMNDRIMLLADRPIGFPENRGSTRRLVVTASIQEACAAPAEQRPEASV